MIALKLRDIALENEKGIKTLPEVVTSRQYDSCTLGVVLT